MLQNTPKSKIQKFWGQIIDEIARDLFKLKSQVTNVRITFTTPLCMDIPAFKKNSLLKKIPKITQSQKKYSTLELFDQNCLHTVFHFFNKFFF